MIDRLAIISGCPRFTGFPVDNRWVSTMDTMGGGEEPYFETGVASVVKPN